MRTHSPFLSFSLSLSPSLSLSLSLSLYHTLHPLPFLKIYTTSIITVQKYKIMISPLMRYSLVRPRAGWSKEITYQEEFLSSEKLRILR
jgi:hypothetical protein